MPDAITRARETIRACHGDRDRAREECVTAGHRALTAGDGHNAYAWAVAGELIRTGDHDT